MKKIFIIIILILPKLAFSQEDTSRYDPIKSVIFLDSFVVKATRKGFDVDDFIKLVRTDESFYKAFRNLRFTNVEFENDIQLFNKKGKTSAQYQSHSIQKSDGRCRNMEHLQEKVSGNFYKGKQKHRYYTAKLYHHLFFTEGKVCEDPESLDWQEGGKGIERHINELKRLIFSPGEKANVPVIGNKTAIFNQKMMPFYDYKIIAEKYRDGTDCYVFLVKVKPVFEKDKKEKTVIKYLKTYFEKGSFQVLGREYRLAAFTLLFDFDVEMKIQLTKKGTKYYPQLIEYDGFWDIPMRKREKAIFRIDLAY